MKKTSTAQHKKAKTSKPSPKPGAGHKRLEALVGRWNTTGRTRATASEPSVEIVAVDTYEWLPGRFFLVHRVDGHLGDAEVKGIEIIGYDHSSKAYTTRFYDNLGMCAVFQAHMRGVEWTVLGKSERFVGRFSDDGRSLLGAWERSIGGSGWQPWMDIKLTKAM